MPVVSLNRDCPGYAEAARREDELRSIPFLGMDERIAGLTAAPLTLRRLQWLTMVKSPFLLKVTVEDLLAKPGMREDIMLFLWIVSPEFDAGNEKAKRRFYKTHGSVLKMDAAKVIKEIVDYVDEAFMDSGESTGEEQRSYYALAASMTELFHRAYGLQIDVWENSWLRRFVRKITGQPNTLDISLRIAFQLMRAHRKAVNGDATFHNRLSQPCIDNWMAEANKPKETQ